MQVIRTQVRVGNEVRTLKFRQSGRKIVARILGLPEVTIRPADEGRGFIAEVAQYPATKSRVKPAAANRKPLVVEAANAELAYKRAIKQAWH